MKQAQIDILDEVNVRIRGVDDRTLAEARNHLTYHVPGYRFMEKVILGRWDGRIRLIGPTGLTYLNLLEDVEHIFVRAGYEFNIVDHRPDISQIQSALISVNENLFADRTWEDGSPVILRDYQIAAVNTAVSAQSGLLEMSVGSGKTLMCAAISRVYQPHGNVVVIVPTIDLVLQTRAKFQIAGVESGIWYGALKESAPVIISTWQSLAHYPNLFEGVICVILDEAHLGKNKTISEIMTGPAAHVPFRFGCTGSIPKEDLFRQQLKASIGSICFRLTSYELQQKGVLANATIYQVVLKDTENSKYPNFLHGRRLAHSKRRNNFVDWREQVDWFFKSPERLRKISELIKEISESGNTLVLVPYRINGKILQDLIPGSVSIDGRDKKRNAVYDQFNQADKAVLICTFGIASTGLDIPRIFNLVSIEPGRKFEKTIQVLGRGLRRSGDKSELLLWDIGSDDGFSHRHVVERNRWYRQANQKIEHLEVAYVDSE